MFVAVWKQIAAGKTLMRSLMNLHLSRYTLASGTVLDLGGGKKPSYFQFIKPNPRSHVTNIDKQYGDAWRKDVDFEQDRLPFEDGSVQQVLVLNVFEHIYNHQHLAREIRRVIAPGGEVIGFVPFLINYHADPHDYFRYTHEALAKIFTGSGFSRVSVIPIGYGPFALNFNTLASFLPRYITTVIWPFYYALDTVLLSVKPGMRTRFPLGYIFELAA